jgi:pimeloyl-ACP methyl ester carboxylesterase
VLIDCGGLGTGLGALEMVSIRRAHDVVGAHRHNLLQMMIHDPDKLDGLALHIQQLHVPLARIDPTPLVLPNMLARALAQTDVAVDAIWGEYDRPHPDPVAQWTALRRYRPDASLRVVPGAGHWSIYENPEAFHRCCDELLAPDSADRSGADETSADP